MIPDPSVAASQRGQSDARNSLFYLLAIVLVVAVYNGLYAFSYYTVTEGWFSEFGHLLREGKVPHVDFHLLLSPFYAALVAAIQSLFGEGFLPLRVAGVVVTGAIGATLFWLLRDAFGRPAAAFAALNALIYYQSGNAYFGYDFTQIVSLLMLLGAVFVVSAVVPSGDFGATQRPISVRLLVGGICFGLAVLTKHSNAGVTTLVFGTAVAAVIYRLHGWRIALQSAAAGGIGLALPIIAMVLWLALKGALSGFIQDLFVDAAAAKGGLAAIFFNWMNGFFLPLKRYLSWSWQFSIRIFALVSACAVLSVPTLVHTGASCFSISRKWDFHAWRTKLAGLWDHQPLPDWVLATGLSVVALGCVANVYTGFHLGWSAVEFFSDETKPILILGAVNICVLGTILLLPKVLRNPDGLSVRMLLITSFGVSLIMGNGTSAGLSEISAYFGYALVLAGVFRAALPWGMAAIPIAVFGFAVSSAWMEARYQSPYQWWQVGAPDARKTDCTRLGGIFEGVCLTSDQASKISQIAKVIEANSGPHDEILVYPHMPVFYLMTQREPFMGAVVSWFDFMSDRQAAALARALLEHPPKVIVVAQLPDIVATEHERLFRGYARSGQRDITEAFSRLEQAGTRCRVADVADVNGLDVAVLAPCPPSRSVALP